MGRPRKTEALPKNSIPEGLVYSKEFKALKKEVGVAAAVEFFERSSQDLKSAMATCVLQKRQIVEETKGKSEYQRLKADIANFTGAMRDAQKPLNRKLAAAAAIVEYRKDADRDTSKGNLEKAADAILAAGVTVTVANGASAN